MALFDGCISYWHFDEGTGTLAEDSIGSNDGTITNPVWADPGKTPQGGGANSGKCLTFNSVTGCYVDCGNDSSLNTPNQITVSFWVKPTDIYGGVGYDRIVTKGNSDLSVSGSWITQFEPSGKITFGCAWADGSYTGITSATVYENDVWYHITMTYDGANIRIYTNGIAYATPVAKVSTIKNSSDHLMTASTSNKQAITFFDGSIDEVCIWNRALTGAEVLELYFSSVTNYTDTITIPIAIINGSTNKASYKSNTNYQITFTPSSLNELLVILAGLPSRLPGPKTTMSLFELTTTKGSTGGRVTSYAGIQTMDGSLQPLTANESVLYNKETVEANYKFLVSQSVFTSVINEAKLTEKNQIRLGNRKFDIVSSGGRTEGLFPHYRVILKEVV
jgi:hypothetical protein